MISQKASGRSVSMPVGICAGVVGGIAALTAMLALLSGVILHGAIRETSIGYGIMAALMLAAFAGASTATSLVKRRRLMVSVLTGVGMLVLLTLLTALLFDGQYEGVLASSAIIFGGSLLVAFTPKNRNPMGKKRQRLRSR